MHMEHNAWAHQIIQAQSHTHLNKMLKRQRAIHMDRYTHMPCLCQYRTHTREPCTNSTSSIAHPLEQNAQEAARELYTWTGPVVTGPVQFRWSGSGGPVKELNQVRWSSGQYPVVQVHCQHCTWSRSGGPLTALDQVSNSRSGGPLTVLDQVRWPSESTGPVH